MRISLLLVLLLLATACGYHNPYLQTTEDQAAGIAEPVSIYVDIWDNRTSEMGFEAQLLQAVADWLQESKLFHLTDRESADYIIRGIITSINYPGASFTTQDRVTSVQAEVTVNYSLVQRNPVKEVWTVSNMKRQSNFSVGANAISYQNNKRDVLKTIADELAEQIYIKTYQTFTSAGNMNKYR